MAWLISVAGSSGRRFLEGRNAIVGVAAIFQLVHFDLEHIADERICHIVVLADTEVEQTAFGMSGQGGAFGPLDLLELVNLAALAVVGPADAVGEERLKPRIGHRGCVSCFEALSK